MVKKPICPRCFGYIPSNSFVGQYPGAISRIDNKTEICSDCGVEEAVLALIPIEEWPIIFYDHEATQSASARFEDRVKIQELENEII